MGIEARRVFFWECILVLTINRFKSLLGYFKDLLHI